MRGVMGRGRLVRRVGSRHWGSGTARWLAAFAGAITLACHASKPMARLVVAVPSSPSTLFPNTARDGTTVSVLSNVYETLVDLDANLALRPGLAESWYTPDDSTWVFRLREGVRCHDGRALEAADVAKSLEHARDDPASARRGPLAGVRAIEAPDPRTVVLRTDRALDTLAARLTSVFVWAPPLRPGEPGVGTGPYRVRSWTPDGDAVLEAVADPRRGPSIPVVTFEVVLDAHERARRLLEGRVHLVVDPPTELRTSLAERPEVYVVRRQGLRVLFLAMDVVRARTPYADPPANPFRDKRVRQGLALAIDRRGLAQGVFKGVSEVVDQVASPHELGAFKDSVPVRPYDPAGAQRLLEAAGYGHGFSVSLDFATGPDTSAIARALQRDLSRIGVRLLLRPALENRFVARIERRDTSLYLMAWNSEIGDGRLSYESLLYSSSGGRGRDNGGGYSDGGMDRLIRDSSRRTTPDERRLLLARLAAKVAMDVPIIPLLRTDDLYAVAEGLAFHPRLDRRIRAADIGWKGPRSAGDR